MRSLGPRTAKSPAPLHPSRFGTTSSSSLPFRLIEISQIGRRLIFPRRHQQSVGAEEIAPPCDFEMRIVLRADAFAPDRPRILHAAPFPGRGPGLRQRIVDRRRYDVKEIRIVLVLRNPLLDDAFIVRMQREAGIVVGARTLEAAALDFERVVAAGAAFIDPLADRVAIE